jgi:hypothetical protein
MGFSLKIEGQETLTYDDKIINNVQAILSTPSDSLAKSTRGYMTLVIAGTLHADSEDSGNSETVKLFKWAQVPAEQEEAYRKVTVQIETKPKRTIIFDKAFVIDYNEVYRSQAGMGNFNIVIRQKVDKIDDVIVDSNTAPAEAPDVAVTTAASTPGDFVSTGSQAGVMEQIGRAAITAALNKVDPSGTVAAVQAGLDKKKNNENTANALDNIKGSKQVLL